MKKQKAKSRIPKRKLIPTGERLPDGKGGEYVVYNVVVGNRIVNRTVDHAK